MLLHLVKKDFLLIKKYILIMMVITIAIPVFIMWRTPEIVGFIAFLISVIFAEFMLYQCISMKEIKYPKADAFLCATPYSRNEIVIARYIFLLLIFAYCVFAYSALNFIFPQIELLSLSNVLLALLISAILFGICTPVQYKIGYEKTKYLFTIVIVATPFILPSLKNVSLNLNVFASLSVLTQNLILLGTIVIVLGISLFASISIYQKKELL